MTTKKFVELVFKCLLFFYSQFIAPYSTEELLSVICPRLARDQVSLYSLLESGIARTPDSVDQRPSFTVMLQQFTELQAKMTEMAQICLRPIQEGHQVADDKEAIQVCTSRICHCDQPSACASSVCLSSVCPSLACACPYIHMSVYMCLFTFYS